MDQIERNCAADAPDAESSAAMRRPLTATSHSALVADKEVLKRNGRRCGPGVKDSWAALPTSSVDGVDGAISALTAHMCGKTLGKEVPREGERKYAPRKRELET